MTDDTKEPTGRQKGGIARSEALSPEARKSIAQRAAAARWGKPLKATHKGNFKEDFGFDVECYVLDDAQKTAVISQRGMGEALGLGKGGSRLPTFVGRKRIAAYVGVELAHKLENPLIFQLPALGTKSQPPTPIHGYDVTILIDLCKIITQVEADGALHPSQLKVAKQAHVILTASAKAGIKGLVYALSGYDATRQEVIEAFKFYVREEAREYEKEFPDMLYDEWYRLYKLPKPERNKPWKFKWLTIDHVYTPIAKSNGKVYELAQAQRGHDPADRHKKLHQFLSEIGVKALRNQLGQLLGIARISKDQIDYEGHVRALFGDQQELFRE